MISFQLSELFESGSFSGWKSWVDYFGFRVFDAVDDFFSGCGDGGCGGFGGVGLGFFGVLCFDVGDDFFVGLS